MAFQTESDAGFNAYIITKCLSPKVQECLDDIHEECSPNSSKSDRILEVMELAQSRRHKSPANATLAKIVLYEFKKVYPFMDKTVKCHIEDCPI